MFCDEAWVRFRGEGSTCPARSARIIDLFYGWDVGGLVHAATGIHFHIFRTKIP